MIFSRPKPILSHRFSEAYDCTKVPVSEVPISPEFPTGLKWERSCRCPRFYTCQSTVLQPDGVNLDGTVKMQKITYNVSGCLDTLLPWMITGIARQSCLAADEAIATGKIVDKMKTEIRSDIAQVEIAMSDPIRQFVLGSVLGINQNGGQAQIPAPEVVIPLHRD